MGPSKKCVKFKNSYALDLENDAFTRGELQGDSVWQFGHACGRRGL